MRSAAERMLAADENLADDRILLTNVNAHVLLIESLIELERKKREINLLEAKLKIEAARHQRMVSGRVR